MQDDQRTEIASLHGFLRALRRRWWVVALCMALVPAAAYGVAALQEDEYTASVGLLLRNAQLGEQALEIAPAIQTSGESESQSATDVELVSLGAVAERAQRALGSEVTAGDIADGVEVESEGDSDVITISVTQSSPKLAAQVGNTYAEEYIDFRRRSERAAILETSRRIERQVERLERSSGDTSERQAELSEAAQQLDLLADVQTGDAEIVQRAEPPSSPSSPGPIRYAGLGLGFGLLVGVALAVLFELISRRLNEPEQIQDVLDRPILGMIPQSRELADSTRDGSPPTERDKDAFQMLRANLHHLDVPDKIRSVVVTSAEPREGKSTVAWHLTAAAAEAGSTVVLLEADLRRPAFFEKFGAFPPRGLSQFLTGDLNREDITNRVVVGRRVGRGSDTSAMDVILAGPLPPSPIDLLESERMRALINDLMVWYDLVVIDTPPLGRVPDALALVKEVSGVLVVSRLRRNTRDAADGLRSQLQAVGASVLGIVVNGTSAGDNAYGYGYVHDRGNHADRDPVGSPLPGRGSS